MAQWSDYEGLFPGDKIPVIQELETAVNTNLGFSTYESYETNFSSITSTFFTNLGSSHAFIQALSSWLGTEATNAGDWNIVKNTLGPNHHPYIDVIIMDGQYANAAEFGSLDNASRANFLISLSGFWAAYLQMLDAYIQDLIALLEIITQPTNQIACSGASASFSVTANGSGVSYQWRKDGVNIGGATSSTLQLNDISAAAEGSYDCVASISSGLSRTSDPANLTIKEEVNITNHPQGLTIEIGANHQLSVAATGGTPLSYQWRKNGVNIDGETSSSLNIENADSADNGSYDCIVGNSCGSVISNVAEITVTESISDLLSVSGVIKNSTFIPLSGITAKLVDRQPGQTKTLGETTTTENGFYQIEFTESSFIDLVNLKGNLQIQLFGSEDTEPRFVSTIQKNVSDSTTIDVITDEFPLSQSEYALVDTHVSEFLTGGVTISELNDEDVSLIAKDFFSEDMISAYVQAHILEASIDTVSAENFYGLVRNEIADKAAELVQTAEDELKNKLNLASENNTISVLNDAEIQIIVDNIKATAAEVIEQSDAASFLAALEEDVALTSAQKQTIIDAHLADPNGETDVWQTLIDDSGSGIGQDDVDEIKRVSRIKEIDPGSSNLVSVLDANAGTQGSPTELNELSTYTVTDWEALIDDADENLLDIPTRFIGTHAEKKTAYAKELRRSTEVLIPTTTFTKRIELDTEIDSTNIDEFMGDKPDFKFEKDKVSNYIDQNPLDEGNYTNPIDEVQKSMESAQRLFHLAPNTDRFESIKPLMKDGVNSTLDIINMGETTFLETYEDQISSRVAKEIFSNAEDIYGKIILTVSKNKNQLNPSVINSSFDTSQTVSGIANLELLFGSLDYCDCQHCRSIYSPAAYMVDLLNYLDYTVSTTSGDVVLKDKLFERRNEISRLHLNCPNTNTPLPYIDIVNEILENAIDPNTDIVRQTEHSAEVLRATPQNIITTVYDTLKTSNYPHQLPFNLWFEQSRAYLNEMNVGIGDFIRLLPIPGSMTQSQHDAISAAGTLGISKQQLNIINGSSGLTFTDLYDVDNLTELVNPIGLFIDKAGVSFELFEKLLKVKYINPNEKLIYYPEDGSCNLDLMTLGDNPAHVPDTDPVIGFSAEELEKFNRFLRLHQLSGWDMKDLDMIIGSVGQGALNDETIANMIRIGELKQRFRIEIEEMLIWWSDFNVSTYIDETLFNRLFQNQEVKYKPGGPIIPEFNAFILEPSPVVETLEDAAIRPHLIGAVKLSSDELDFILAKGEIDTNINLKNLSYLYRISTFTKAARLSVEEFFEHRELSGLDGITILVGDTKLPADTIEFLEKMELIENVPLNKEEISFLMKGEFSENLSLANTTISEFLQSMRNEFGELIINDPEDLDTELNDLLGLYVSDQTYINTVISGTQQINSGDLSTVQDAIDTFGKIIGDNEETAFETSIPLANSETERKEIIYHFFQRHHLIQSNFGTVLAEKLGQLFDLPIDVANHLYALTPASLSSSLFDQTTEINFLTSEEITDDTNYADAFKVMQHLAKIALLTKQYGFNEEELNYLINELPASWTQLSDLPLEGEPNLDLSAIEPIISLRQLDQNVFVKGVSLVEYLARQTTENRLSSLAEATGWNINDINALVGDQGFNYEVTPAVYEETSWINRLSQTINMLQKVKLDAAVVLGLSYTNPDADFAAAMSNMLYSRFGEKQWNSIAIKVHDPIREKQRDAMVAYLIATDENFNRVQDIYDHFLIDTQMSACQLTSRIKQANSAIQLFVQRINLGFEGELRLNKSKMNEWQWRKNYRVWEANRKVFLYPENFLLPELRTDQSKLFTEFAETLTQEEVTSDAAEEAYQKYLEGFIDIANLKVNQMAYENDSNTLHIIANNHQNPKQYFYRAFQGQSIWTPWELIPIGIEGGVLPVIHRGKLMLFWKQIKEQKGKPELDKEFDTTENKIPIEQEAADSEYEVRVAWTVKNKKGWEPQQLSSSSLVIKQQMDLNKIVLSPMHNEFSELFITVLTPLLKGSLQFCGVTKLNLMLEKAYKLVLGDLKEIDFKSDNSFAEDLNDINFVKTTAYEYEDSSGFTQIDRLSGLGISSNSNEEWKKNRSVNLARLSGIFSNNPAINSPLTYSNNKLKLKNHNVFMIPYFDEIETTAFGNGGLIENYIIRGVKVLNGFSHRSFELIRSMEEEFPILKSNKWNIPFIINDKGKYFIISMEFLNNEEKLDITNANLRNKLSYLIHENSGGGVDDPPS